MGDICPCFAGRLHGVSRYSAKMLVADILTRMKPAAMGDTELEERLLYGYSNQEDCSRSATGYLPRREPTKLGYVLPAFICLLVSVLGNIYQYRQICQTERTKDLGRSKFSASPPLVRISFLTWLIGSNRRLGV